MADENVNENEEAPVEETPAEAVEETPAAEAPAAEAAPEEAPAEAEAPVAEAQVENAADEVAAEAPAAAEAEPAAPAAPAEPKQKKKRLSRAERPARSKPKREKPAERKPIVRLEKPEGERGRRPERQGTVVSDKMDKTIVVKVDMIRSHPKYKKVVRRSVKFHAHDEQNQAKIGDVVRIVETRPLSALKRWRLAEIVEVAK